MGRSERWVMTRRASSERAGPGESVRVRRALLYKVVGSELASREWIVVAGPSPGYPHDEDAIGLLPRSTRDGDVVRWYHPSWFERSDDE